MNSVNSCFESAAKCFRGVSAWSFFIALLVFAFAAMPAHAQIQNGIFTGTVTDPQGASVGSADVTVMNIGTNATTSVKSNAEGLYRIAELPVGTYKFTVTAPGFKKAVKTGLYLGAGTIERVDFKLELGQQSETVVVEAGAVLVQTDDARLSTTIASAQISNLPLNGRNVFDLIQLAPGAVNADGVSFENGHNTVVNGLRPNFTGFMINGASDKGLSGGVVTTPNADMVQEFQELTLNMSAQYGNSAAAIVNVVTKSGGNTLHGSVYEFLRNDKLDANEFFRNTETNFPEVSGKPPKLRYNQFGATITGPIMKDHLFFTASYQGDRFVGQAPATPILSESSEWRNAIVSAFPGSTAALVYKDFPTVSPGDPNNANSLTLANYVAGGGGGSGSGFGTFGDYMCPDNFPTGFSGVMSNFVNLFGITAADQTYLTGTHPKSATNPTPVPNCASYFGGAAPAQRAGAITDRNMPFLNQNLVIFGSQTQGNLFNGNEFSTRIDWVKGQKDRVFGEFHWLHALDSFGPLNASSSIHGFKNATPTHAPNLQLSWSHTFSPNWINEARAGYALNLTENHPNAPGVPSVGFDDGSAGFGSYNGYPQVFHENIYSYADMMSFQKGKHSIKVGADFRRNLENSEFNIARPSYYFFDQLYFAADAPYGMVAGVDPGFVTNRPAQLATNNRAWRNLEVGAYIQDDWKVRKNLTINIGLRYDLYTRHVEKFGRQTTFIPGPGGVTPANGIFLEAITNANVPAGSPGCNTADQIRRAVLAGVCGPGGFARAKNLGAGDHNNFGPRVGFAWDPFSKGKTSIRGGFGVSYEGTLYNPLSNSRWNPPFYSFNLAFNALGGNTQNVIYGPQTPGQAPTFTGPPTNPGQGIGAQAVGNLSGWDATNPNTAFLTGIVFPEGIKDPYILNFFFGVQHEVFSKTVVTVNYVGTQGRKLFRAENANRFPGTAACLARDSTGACIPGVGFGPNATFTAQGRTLTALNRRNLNPNYGRLRVWENVSRSWYNALQASVRRPVGTQLVFAFDYAWSHSIDTGSTWHSGATTANGNAAGEGFSLDQTRPELDRGNSIFDVRHRLTFSYTWQLPWFKAQQGFLGHILGGWQYNGIWAFQSGAHWSPYCATGPGCDFNKDGERNDRPDAPNGNNIDASRQQWANGFFKVPGSTFTGAFSGSNPFFATPCLGCNGNLGRNTFVGPGIYNTDQSIFKNLQLTERFKAQFRLEMFNAFNHANFTLPNSATGG